MPSDLKPLQEFFSNRVFRIPDYQRGYAWGVEQVEDFWEDLWRIPHGRNHYAGQITLESVNKSGWEKWDEDIWLITGRSYKPFYVVDGQQRLTTSVILIKCLIDTVAESGVLACRPKQEQIGAYLFCCDGVSRSYIFGYEKDNPSYEFLKSRILDQSDNSFKGTDTVYTANLAAARKFFETKLASMSGADVEEGFKRLTQRFVVNEYQLSEDLDVFVAFETMNNRGKKLSQLELLKNRLIYISTLLKISPDECQSLRRNITNAWKTVYEYLGKEKDDPLDDDEFLRVHWIVSFRYSRDEANQFSKFLLGEHFTPERAANGGLTAHEIQAYVDSIQTAAVHWHTVNFPDQSKSLSDKAILAIKRLHRLGMGALTPLVLSAVIKSRENALLPLLEQAERFCFLIRRLCNRKANTGDTDFYRLAGKLYRDECNPVGAAAEIQNLVEYFFSAERVQTELRELFNNEGGGFYQWSGLQFFLFEYEEFLRNRAGMHDRKIDWDVFATSKADYVTVEHIYPQNPKSGDWPAFQELPKNVRHFLKHSLGNLLALSKRRNSKFSNNCFNTKKHGGDGAEGYFNGSHSEIAVSTTSEWTPLAVLDRGMEMLSFLEERWKISLGSESDKILTLRLEELQPIEKRPVTKAQRINAILDSL